MVENNCLREDLREELCAMRRNRSAAFTRTGLTSYFFFIRKRPKLLTNDCLKINEGTAINHSHFPFCAAGMLLFSNFKMLQY